uniref:beta-catenin-like protein 1 n=1 Tax=Styela clava TaxID=7725 RepID=UPI001939930E|nr:beta-catenin-like protein 1 [Styela clava]
MDIGELLDYKPNLGKRDIDGNDNPSEKPKKKSARLQLGNDMSVTSGIKRGFNTVQTTQSISNIEEEERQMKLLEMVEGQIQISADAIETLDDQSIKKMILSFEKRVLKNQEMRIKFSDNPEKFMESELDLNDIVSEMKVLATMPEHYHYLVELRAVNSFLALVNHANADISIAVIDLLQELTDIDTLTENEEGAEVLIDALMDGQVSSLLVQNMDRLDETVKEEAEAVHHTLGVIENMIELKPELCPVLAQQDLLQWLLKRLKLKKEFDANKLYCAEILSILLQRHDETRKLLGEHDGIDILLQLLAVYKRNDPISSEETELMENLFNCLCSSLLYEGNRSLFLKGEGLQLMNLMLREKKMSRNSALKVLDHAMTGYHGADNCAKFVEILGLRTLFPLFMRPPKKQKKGGVRVKVHEEHVVSIISSMLRNLQGPQRQRLISKFTESDLAKVDRLMEIHFKYYSRVQAAENKLEKEKAMLQAEGKDWDEEMEDEHYMSRLDAGLFILQQVDYIIVEVASSGLSAIKQRIQQILNLRGGSVKSIRTILREYAGSIGEGEDESAKTEQQRIMGLADKF